MWRVDVKGKGEKETHREKRRGRREERKELAAQDVEHEEQTWLKSVSKAAKWVLMHCTH